MAYETALSKVAEGEAVMPTRMNNSLPSWCTIVYGMVTGAGGIPPLFAHAQTVYTRLSSRHTPKEPGNEARWALTSHCNGRVVL